MEKIKDFKEVSKRIRTEIEICHDRSKVLNAKGIIKRVMRQVDPEEYDPEMLMEKAISATLMSTLNQQGAYSFKRGAAIYIYAAEASSINILRQLAKNQGESIDSDNATIKTFQDIANNNFNGQLVWIFGEDGAPAVQEEQGMESTLDELMKEAYPPVETEVSNE